MKTLYLLRKIALFLIILITPGLADAQISFSPMIKELSAYPGGIERFNLSMMNSGNEILDCKIETFPMKLVGDGLPVASEDGARSCHQWIDIKPREFKLNPKADQRLVCNIKPPKGTVGGYYALISCLGVPESFSEEERGTGSKAAVRFRYRVQSVIILKVRGSHMKAVIEPGEPLIESKKDGSGITFKVPIRNLGNVHDRMTGQVVVKSDAGQTIDRFELGSGRGFLLPEHERIFESKGVLNLPNGSYVAEINLTTGSGRPMRRRFPFIIEDGEPIVADITDAMRAELEEKSAGFIVIPPKTSISLPPGARRPQVVELRNLTRDTIPLRAVIKEWVQDETGANLVVDGETQHGRSASGWIQLPSSDIDLTPLSKRKIPLLIGIPRDGEGERYAAITFDRRDMVLNSAPQNLPQRSVLLQVSAQGTGKPNSEVDSFTTSLKDNGAVKLSTLIKNTGTIGFVPDITFRIVDGFNNEIGKMRATSQQSFIQAGSSGVIAMEWDRILDPGKYDAELIFRYDPDIPPIIKRTSFTIGVNAFLEKIYCINPLNVL